MDKCVSMIDKWVFRRCDYYVSLKNLYGFEFCKKTYQCLFASSLILKLTVYSTLANRLAVIYFSTVFKELTLFCAWRASSVETEFRQ